MTDQPFLLFIFGVGYTAQSVARQQLAAGWRVSGTVRTEEKAARLCSQGIDARAWDGQGQVDVPAGAHWLVTLPPDAGGCPAARACGHLAARAASVTYLSTTGVYGDLDGGWAFEDSPLNPQSERARARVRAEQQWRAATDGRARIVRLPGIYGPGRSALDRVRAGTARRIIKPGQVFSRIHVADIASAVAALLERPGAKGIFHICDDEPAPPQDVISYAARLLDRPEPPAEDFASADLSPMARSFYADCKRVSNARAKSALGWRPAWPTYREGLAAILKDEAAPG